MMSAHQIQEILSLYTKHGWTLRRVLLSPKLKTQLADKMGTLFNSAEIFDAEIDAIWLSRAAAGNAESWEIRRLSETPYALLEVFDEDDEEEVREEIRRELEVQIQGKSSMISG
jgi:hypothetical protein